MEYCCLPESSTWMESLIPPHTHTHYWDCRNLIFLHLLVLESLFSSQVRLNAATSWLFLAPVSFSIGLQFPQRLYTAQGLNEGACSVHADVPFVCVCSPVWRGLSFIFPFPHKYCIFYLWRCHAWLHKTQRTFTLFVQPCSCIHLTTRWNRHRWKQHATPLQINTWCVEEGFFF